MKASHKRGITAAISVLLAVLVVFLSAGLMINSTALGTWSSLCETDDKRTFGEIIQTRNSKFLIKENIPIIILESQNGCEWSSISSPTSDRDIWLSSATLFLTPDGQLGLVWSETDKDKDKKSRTAIFSSIYDGSTWSDPQIHFHRDEFCLIDDAMMLENGNLLLMWSERLVLYHKDGERTYRGSGCHVVYRACIEDNEVYIERVIEPEDPSYCYSRGYAFIDDGERIWCICEHGSWGTYFFYRSSSQDGKKWSPPEQFEVPVPGVVQILLTPQGEIGIFDYDFQGTNLYLYRSTDWEHWSQEKLFVTKSDIEGSRITCGKDEAMWGIIHTSDGFLSIHSSQEAAQEYWEKMKVVNMLGSLSVCCIVLLVLLSFFWMWKRLKSEDGRD